ncbi:DUF4974 domain-containing protein [Sphingobacterium sp. SGG-5]|uniref:FecR family protein n=1 Tax=Sphingobacterium sp. SGG-5 TaxID=2710881 RepID=UPI0013EB7CBB|nr:FecR family protein [Sphingobacterium sp. SGG-5]NGM60841.1 DUF4974 domain-containing protein [Sphingobacterium sp. SGG-5]
MQRVEELYDKYLNDTISDTEKQELFDLIRQADDSRLAALADRYLRKPESEDLNAVQADIQRILQYIKHRIIEQENIPSAPVKTFILGKWFAVAAAVLIVSFAGYYIYNTRTISKQPQLTNVYGDDVLPGGNRATMTLSNGEIIELSEDKDGIVANGEGFTYADGEQVVATSDAIQYATLATPSGGQYQLTLPDGSKVWLNAVSSITYPTRFESSQRLVKLQGEAFFDVAEDKTKPFIVESNDQRITVTGTTFNVEAYGDQRATNTTLVSGSVHINSNNGHRIVLEPGQTAILHDNGFKSLPADIQAVTGWVKGEFVFHYSTLADILPQLERWYDIQSDIAPIPQDAFYAEISRNMPLSAVLKAIEETSNLRFEIKERRLLLKKR